MAMATLSPLYSRGLVLSFLFPGVCTGLDPLLITPDPLLDPLPSEGGVSLVVGGAVGVSLFSFLNSDTV